MQKSGWSDSVRQRCQLCWPHGVCHRPLCSSPFWAVLRNVSWGNSDAPRIYAVCRSCIDATQVLAPRATFAILLHCVSQTTYLRGCILQKCNSFWVVVSHSCKSCTQAKLGYFLCYFAVAMKVYFRLCFVVFQMQTQEYISSLYASIWFNFTPPVVGHFGVDFWHAERLKFTLVW